MQKSDLTGAPIDPAAKEEIVVRLADGKSRRLVVTAAEADELSSSGTDADNRWMRTKAAVGRNMRPFAWWAFALVVGSVLLPAATRQWSDRQAALTLKSSLVADVSKSSVTAVFAAQRVAEMPAGDAQAKARQAALDGWVVSEAGIDPLMAAYFDDTQARTVWREFRDPLYLYIALACCDEHRAEHVATLKGYLSTPTLREPTVPPIAGEDPWMILRAEPVGSLEFRKTYAWAGLELLSRRGLLHQELRRTKADGYSVGFEDFWRDVIPGL